MPVNIYNIPKPKPANVNPIIAPIKSMFNLSKHPFFDINIPKYL